MKKLLIFEMPLSNSPEGEVRRDELIAKIEGHSMNDDFHVLCLNSESNTVVIHEINPKVDLI